VTPEQIRTLLKNPNLAPAQRAALEAKIADAPAHPAPDPKPSYTAEMDAEFLAAGEKYEAERSNVRLGIESPLHAIEAHPVGRLWHAAFAIRLLGGWDTKAREHMLMLLPVLRHSRSEDVQDQVFRALRALRRNYPEQLGAELTAELGEALDTHVRKMDGVA
jgi:hypothetical protein